MSIPRESRPCDHCDGSGSITRIDGAKVREIRERAGYGLRQMAREVGVGASYLSDMELGKREMSEDVARRILEVCDAD